MATTKVNVICGPLGVGKSSAILKLVAKKRSDAKWAILVNEIGDVGIDGTTLGAVGGIATREIAGGCMCCAGGVPFRVALTELVRRERPERVLVEPSGLGKVSALRAVVTQLNGFEMCATICLVPADMHHRLWGKSEQYVDQVHSSDVLAVNRRDKVESTEDIDSFVRNIYPPKRIAFVQFADIDPDLLDAKTTTEVTGDETETCSFFSFEGVKTATVPPRRVDRGDGSIRIESVREGRRLVGWIFEAEWLFDKNKLQALFSSSTHAPLDRAKGVFRTNRGTLYAHWGCDGALLDTQLIQQPASATRSDSRAQLIFVQAPPPPPLPETKPASSSSPFESASSQEQQPFSFSPVAGCEDEDAFLRTFEAAMTECRVRSE